MKKRIIFAILVIVLFAYVACIGGCIGTSNSSTNSTTNNYTSYTPSIPQVTEYEAIRLAKESQSVQNDIATAKGLKFYYPPEWGTCTAEKNSVGNWKVTLKGNISGYTDDYRTNFKYDLKFTATTTVYPYGGGASYASVY